jgi:hypothetical protein
MNTYIGKKGYTIYKNELSPEQIKKIKADLTIKPHVHGAPIQNSQSAENIYFVYRESSNKLYVPQHYGIKNFGKPTKIELAEGENIQLEFNGQLREHQVPVVQKYMENIQNGGSGGLIELQCGGRQDFNRIKFNNSSSKKNYCRRS